MKRLKPFIKAVIRPAMPMAHATCRVLTGTPGVGKVDMGDLRRLRPISGNFGSDRGTPLDRFYIHAFLERHAADVRGSVLEIGEATYTRRYGGARVTQSDILYIDDTNPDATIVADLAHAPQIPDARFDAIILTQTLQFIFDVGAALRTLQRILKPGGVLLLTVPGISPVGAGTLWGPIWMWSFTEVSMRRLLTEAFGAQSFVLEVHGNVLVATAFLHGLAAEDMQPQELADFDPSYPVIIAARVQKAAG
jgi:SAM-dependent methyltransferase